jgi:hypothetical protein
MLKIRIRSFVHDKVENWFIVTQGDLDSGVESQIILFKMDSHYLLTRSARFQN